MARNVTVFWSRLRNDVPPEYGELAAEIESLAREIDGFVDYRSLTAANGDHLSIAIFETAEAEATWRSNLAHRAAQRRGREHFYEWYDVSVCEEVRRHHWEAPVAGPSDSSDAN
jgi:heme-degrading monooxygenase HmoA